MKKLLFIALLILLISCKKEQAFISNMAKSDIDIITDIHAKNAKEYTKDLIIKLYKLNPKYLEKNDYFNNISDVMTDIFKEVDHKTVDKTGQKNIDLILKGFDKKFNGDRIHLIGKGLYGMIHASYRYKEKFYLIDKRLDPQKLINSAINIETLIWRLTNTRDNDELLIVTNTMEKNQVNLSFERLFGKLIQNQENISYIISAQEGRIVEKVTTGIVSSLFLPIGF